MFRRITSYTLLLLFVTTFVIACQNARAPIENPNPTKPPVKYTKCSDPRPQVCTREYRPVCATKDTGIRCVTTPCPSTELKTYSTACVACSDRKVFGYQTGACQ